MKQRTAVISGASSGIGRELALDLARENFSLGLLGRDQERLREVQAACEKFGVKVEIVPVDLRQPEKITTIIDDLSKRLGGISVLVNNAGVSIEKHIDDATMEDWNTSLDVNLRAVFALTKAALPHLRESDGAAVINIASIASRRSYQGGTLYVPGKHGLLGFSNSLFEDLREEGIKVTAIMPGYVNTPMHANDTHLDPQKMIQPADISRAVRFVLEFTETACPTEITIYPQRSPKRRK